MVFAETATIMFYEITLKELVIILLHIIIIFRLLEPSAVEDYSAIRYHILRRPMTNLSTRVYTLY